MEDDVFNRDKIPMNILPGSVFERSHGEFNSVEVAEVIWVGDDVLGIPHVRFQFSYRYSNREEGQGVRILALKAFAERFRPVAAAA